jgi:hypothetical protein
MRYDGDGNLLTLFPDELHSDNAKPMRASSMIATLQWLGDGWLGPQVRERRRP